MNSRPVTITPFEPGDGEAFAALNLAWLVGHGLLEPADEKQLYNPQGYIFGHGGEIFMARIGEVPIECCAAIPRGDGSMEVAKLAVDTAAQGNSRRNVSCVISSASAGSDVRARATARIAGACRATSSSNARSSPPAARRIRDLRPSEP